MLTSSPVGEILALSSCPCVFLSFSCLILGPSDARTLGWYSGTLSDSMYLLGRGPITWFECSTLWPLQRYYYYWSSIEIYRARGAHRPSLQAAFRAFPSFSTKVTLHRPPFVIERGAQPLSLSFVAKQLLRHTHISQAADPHNRG